MNKSITYRKYLSLNIRIFYVIYMLLTLSTISCTDKDEMDDNLGGEDSGIIYAVPSSRGLDGFESLLYYNSNYILMHNGSKGSSIIIGTKNDDYSIVIVDFDNEERITSISTQDYLMLADYASTTDTHAQFTLYEVGGDVKTGEFDVKTNVGHSRSVSSFEDFDVPIVSRAIKTKNVVDQFTDMLDPRDRIMVVINSFFNSTVTNPHAKFAWENGTNLIVSGLKNEYVNLPLGMAISMYEHGMSMIEEMREVKYKQCAGLLDVMTIEPMKVSDGVYEFGIAAGSTLTVPPEYQGKNIVGLIYKAVEIDEPDDIDLLDEDANILFQVAPTHDDVYTEMLDIAAGKKIVYRAFIIPATEVPRYQNGLITRTGCSLIKQTDVQSFITLPVAYSYNIIDFKGWIATSESKVYNKKAYINIEINASNPYYLSGISTPITDWGVVLYREGEIYRKVSMVTEKDNPYDNSDPTNVTSTQNLEIDAEYLTLDYDNFIASTFPYWSIGTFVVYHQEDGFSREEFGEPSPLNAVYSQIPSFKWTAYEVGNVRPYEGEKDYFFINYSAYAESECMGVLFIDEVFALEYFADSDKTYIGDTATYLVDGTYVWHNHDYKNWAVGKYEDSYSSFWKMVSHGRVFYFDNCIHTYCNGTLESFDQSISSSFPGQRL